MTLKNLEPTDLHHGIALLSALAYIPIVAEKNDGLLLWKQKIVREKTERVVAFYESLKAGRGVEELVRRPFFSSETALEGPVDPHKALFSFTPRVAAALVTMIENGEDPRAVAGAFRSAAGAVREHEDRHGLYDPRRFRWNVKFSTQTRYRNTLFLYMGNHFERMGLEEEAFDAYVRDLYKVDICDSLGFYLTAMKTCERLICAYRTSPPEKERILFRGLIDRCILMAFHRAAEYAGIVLDYIRSTPGLDLTQERFTFEDGTYMLYGGEPSREVFLISLLYQKVVQGVDFGDIDYSRYLIFRE
jgi:hypothetical protein